MRKETVVTIITLIIILTLLAGCKDKLQDNLIETLSRVQAQVEISVQLPDGLEPDGGLTYTLSGSHSNGKDVVDEQPFDIDKKTVLTLNPGTWTFTIRAVDTGNVEMATGSSNALSIKRGQRAETKITLTYTLYGAGLPFTIDPATNSIVLSSSIVIDGPITIPEDVDVIIESGATVKIDDFTIKGNVTIQDNVTIDGDLTVEKNLTATGDLVVTGDASVGKFEVTDDATFTGNLTVTEGLVVNEGATLTVNNGTLDLGNEGWNSVNFGDAGTITLDGTSADLKIGETSKKWYTLDGAKAEYFKKDGEVQLRFVTGSDDNMVTPIPGTPSPTESLTRVGSGVTFDLTTDAVKLEGKNLTFEDGSTTILGKNWWNHSDTNLTFEYYESPSTITVEPGATVQYGSEKNTWIGSSDGAEWKTTGETTVEFHYVKSKDTDPNPNQTIIKGTETESVIPSLILTEWDFNSGVIGHKFIIDSNASVVFDMDIVVRDSGSIHIKSTSRLAINTGYSLKIDNGTSLTIDDGGKIEPIGSYGGGTINIMAGSKVNGTLAESGKTYPDFITDHTVEYNK